MCSTYEYNGEKKTMAVTQFEPADARRCFPCWDEPACKVCLHVSLSSFWMNLLSALSRLKYLLLQRCKLNTWNNNIFGVHALDGKGYEDGQVWMDFGIQLVLTNLIFHVFVRSCRLLSRSHWMCLQSLLLFPTCQLLKK